jgi:hypothetical protein
VVFLLFIFMVALLFVLVVESNGRRWLPLLATFTVDKIRARLARPSI